MTWSIDSETAPLRAVLLCPPDHYKWIPTNAIACQTLEQNSVFERNGAQAQYRELVSALEGAGVACHYLTAEPHLPYQVYTRDSSQTTPWGTVLTQLSLPERRGEIGGVLAFYGHQGGFWKVSTHGAIEGGDIHLIRPGLGIVGFSGVRTTLPAAREFAGWFEAEGWEMRLQPFAEHFLHLDVLFCMAADGIAVACTEVLGDDFATWLGRNGIRTVGASYREVMAMSCNVLALGDGRVLSPRHSARLNAALRAEGLTVLDPELDIFARGGGSVHCLTMPLRRDLGTAR